MAGGFTQHSRAVRVEIRKQVFPVYVLLDDVVTLKHLLDGFERAGNLLLGMRGHERIAYQGVVGSYGGRNHRVDEYALVEEVARNVERLVVVADEERDDGMFREPRLSYFIQSMV